VCRTSTGLRPPSPQSGEGHPVEAEGQAVDGGELIVDRVSKIRISSPEDHVSDSGEILFWWWKIAIGSSG
jgi:hypothetical protein